MLIKLREFKFKYVPLLIPPRVLYWSVTEPHLVKSSLMVQPTKGNNKVQTRFYPLLDDIGLRKHNQIYRYKRLILL